MSANGTSYTVDDMTTVYSTPVHEVGMCVVVDDSEYRFVQNGNTCTGTVGYPAVLVGTDGWDVTVDIAAEATNANALFVGMVMGTMATAEYGWLLRSGIYDTCTVADTVTNIAAPVVLADTDGSFRAATAGDLLNKMLCGYVAEPTAAAATGVNIWIDAL